MLGGYVRGKVFVFIDAANILYSQQSLGWRVDYSKIKIYCERECLVGKLFFYTGQVGDNKKQASFLSILQELGYIIRAKEVKRIRTGFNTFEWKGNLDVELVIDALKYSAEFDTCVLMSGDSDFAPLVDELKSQGKWAVSISSKDHISRELIQRTKYINLNKLRNFIEFNR